MIIKFYKFNTKFRIHLCAERSAQVRFGSGKTTENFVWKEVNRKKIQIRLNNLQNKIYAARKKSNIKYLRKLQKTILNSHDFKKLAVLMTTK